MIKARRNPDYSDLDLDFIANPSTGDVSILYGEDAIKRSVRNLILTNFYDFPFESRKGSNVQKILFDNINNLTATNLKDQIIDVIQNFEPRVSLLSVAVIPDPDNNLIVVQLKYSINNRLEPVTQAIALERVR